MAEYFGTSVEAIFNTMPERFKSESTKGIDVTIGYDITGEGGGKWIVAIKDGTLVVDKIDDDIPVCSVIITANAETFIGGTIGKIDLGTAMSAGKFKVNGDITVMTNIVPKAFKKFRAAGDDKQAEELISLKVTTSINQRFSTGPHMGKWFKGLKEKKFYASRCPSCGRTQIPPREVCAECVVRSDEYVEIGPNGTVANMDIVYYASPDPLTGAVRSTPYVTLYLWMDGSTPGECLSFDLNPKDTNRIKRGMRVRPVWNEVRTGGIDDLLYFEIDD
ncbi:MAG TPA: SCP2 sterol-binding domain-containing protein [Syntrophomonadaceae bacterium]|nr:SCP2 sterol-binding domain-containing protein [Syntrophomonadaceae bacterium]